MHTALHLDHALSCEPWHTRLNNLDGRSWKACLSSFDYALLKKYKASCCNTWEGIVQWMRQPGPSSKITSEQIGQNNNGVSGHPLSVVSTPQAAAVLLPM
ncbi:unnamed protein product [Urochloa humidicola]